MKYLFTAKFLGIITFFDLIFFWALPTLLGFWIPLEWMPLYMVCVIASGFMWGAFGVRYYE